MKRSKVLEMLRSELWTVQRMTEGDWRSPSADFVEGYWHGRRVSIEDSIRLLSDGEDLTGGDGPA